MIGVIGGGPAGLAAATVLARAGREVVVHEAGTWPRHRVCGEFLSPDAEAPLAAMGLDGLAGRLLAPRIGAVRVTSSRAGRVAADAGWGLEVPGWGVSRFDLDAALAEAARAAGAEVVERSRADRATLKDATAVILACGRVSPSAGRGPRDWIGLKVHVRGVRLPGRSELHAVPGAYVGLNEVVRGGEIVVNVCALLRGVAWRRAGASPDLAWEFLARESPAFAQRWRAATPEPGTFATSSGFSFARREAVRGGALVVGDAAGLVAPLSGAGQAAALGMGVAAARCLVSAADASTAWTQAFVATFGRRLRLGRALQGALLSANGAPWLVRAVGRSPRAARWVYRATRGPFVSAASGVAAPP